jgi:ribosome-associated toxin RatA of RatAB toxin-antitoxin module
LLHHRPQAGPRSPGLRATLEDTVMTRLLLRTPAAVPARRRVALWTAIASLLMASTVAATAPTCETVVREADGVYSVTTTFVVTQPAAVAAAVLTDYDHIARFMPDVQVSRVVERSERRAVVQQEAVARFMLFSRRIYLMLEVEEEPGVIRFRDRDRRSFERYEGSWRIVEKEGQVTIAYELNARPTFDVPEFLLKRLLKRDAQQMIVRLQSEMAARAAAAGGSSLH